MPRWPPRRGAVVRGLLRPLQAKAPGFSQCNRTRSRCQTLKWPTPSSPTAAGERRPQRIRRPSLRYLPQPRGQAAVGCSDLFCAVRNASLAPPHRLAPGRSVLASATRPGSRRNGSNLLLQVQQKVAGRTGCPRNDPNAQVARRVHGAASMRRTSNRHPK